MWALLALRRDGVGTFIINIITEHLCASPCADTLGDVPDNVFFATGVLYLQLSAGKKQQSTNCQPLKFAAYTYCSHDHIVGLHVQTGHTVVV